MKILSRYILKEHIAPFFFAFFTITFLLVIDFVPKITDHVIDKDLSVWVALELLGLNLAWMLALSVPMAVLVACLMAFGRLTADFEITALKASGVNMLRVIFPLLVAGAVLTFGMVEFNDKILPDLNKRERELWGDISAMRPTLVFRSGVFISDIPGYLVLIDHIDHQTSRVEGVRITDTRDNNKPRIIVAKYGYLKMTDHNKNMQFTLYDGEIHSLDVNDATNYRRVDFDKQIINVSEAGTELQRTDSDYRGDREMNIKDMKLRVVNASKQIDPFRTRMYDSYIQRVDYLFTDSALQVTSSSTSDSAAYSRVKANAATFSRQVGRNRQQIESQQRIMDKYQLEIYKKYSIPGAIIAFILIGAPLGVMSKRKGMGMAIAISIIMFIIYWAFLIGGEDLADRGLVPPFWCMWSANFLIGGVGLYLLYIVVTEKPLFSYFRQIK
ncbi:MAG TPA: LptF/LptG family permease [candidate division Zixibacteria bacterium]|nr:LptF/LptG family permease [candidate division Zixibacteria bacterium]